MQALSFPDRQSSVSPQPAPSELTSALLTYTFPPALVTRLHRQERWSMAQTLRVLNEYRRFLYLAATCPFAVTPPRTVDEAWHLHLTFTRDYWEGLTPLLPAPLHHEPAPGQPGDAATYAAQYLRTLDAYAQTFGPPPADVWPDPRTRRAPARSPWTAARWTLGRWAIAPGAALLAWATFAWSPVGWLIALGVLLAVGVYQLAQAAPLPPQRQDNRRTDGGSSSGSSTFSGSDDSRDGASDGGNDGGSSDGGGSSCGGGCGGGCGS